jgi:hypothetical protein
MARTRQIAGGIVLGVMTLVVSAGAACALWLGAPLLNPAGDRLGAKDIPIINTDAKIVRPLPPAEASPRAGIVQPAPTTTAPKPQAVSHKSTRRPHSELAVATPHPAPARVAARPVEVASASIGDDGRSARTRRTGGAGDSSEGQAD